MYPHDQTQTNTMHGYSMPPIPSAPYLPKSPQPLPTQSSAASVALPIPDHHHHVSDMGIPVQNQYPPPPPVNITQNVTAIGTMINRYEYPPPPPQPPRPPVVVLPPFRVEARWTTGLFDCFLDPGNAIMTFLCPCLTFGEIAEIVDHGRTWYGTNALLYMLIAWFFWFPCIISCIYRTKLRRMFELPQHPAPDCLVHFFFECCALTQEHRELRLRGLNPSIGWQKNVARNQRMYQQQEVVMHPPPTQIMIFNI